MTTSRGTPKLTWTVTMVSAHGAGSDSTRGQREVDLERGELIGGRYELIKRLGRGGMGEVWAGRDRSLRRDVAIKLLAVDDAPHPELALRFEREAVAAAQINHAHAVALYTTAASTRTRCS
ncbi:hypothetical protein ACFVT5_21245 [Streptomyces sp. NPDC058001]|uniref:hypothetical protein n=1 Tax=Streptomyces sp. NPDC058001 TaxID=3346300 RepID=UPI0036E7E1D8